MAWKRAEESPEPNTPNTYAPQASSPPSPSPSSSTPRRASAVIGESITIQGDLAGKEDLTILGRVQGKIDVEGNSVTIGQSGFVKADVYGKSVFVEGRVEGNLFGGEQIVLRSTGDVRGNLTAPRVSLEDGAQFKGAIDMEPKRSASSGSGASAPSGSGSQGGSRPGGSSSGAGSSGSSSSSISSEREKAVAKAGA